MGLRRSLQDLQCFGTDGEQALENALHTQFRSASHLCCFSHFRGNIEDKLSQLNVPGRVMQEFVWDIFGNPALLQEGLVDADSSESLDTQFDSLEKTWNSREVSATKCTEPQFHQWFRTHSLEVVRKCMLKEERVAAGMGSPPEPFYTNDVESKNRVLKYQTSYTPQQLPQFVDSMKDLFQQQREEVEKAVAGLGEYRICTSYSHLSIQTKQWFQKTEKQRLRVL